jgi:hypothetical protein
LIQKLIPNPRAYFSTEHYLKSFFLKGGSVQALPSLTAQPFSMTFTIEPDGNFSLTTTYSHIQQQPFRTLGYLSP